MSLITQVEPVTNLQRSYQALFSKIENGPVILTNRGTAAAVLLSVDEYDRQRQELAYYRRQAEADRVIAADEWVDGDEVAAHFEQLGAH